MQKPEVSGCYSVFVDQWEKGLRWVRLDMIRLYKGTTLKDITYLTHHCFDWLSTSLCASRPQVNCRERSLTNLVLHNCLQGNLKQTN